MASRQPNDSISASDDNSAGHEWSKLSPAISSQSPAPQPVKADDLLTARRAEQQREEPVADSKNSEIEISENPSAVPAQTVILEKASAQPKDSTDSATVSIIDREEEASRRVSARESALADRPRALKLRALLIALTVPVLTLMVAIRSIASTPFLWLAYHRPGFPEDSYGFSTDERMSYGSYGLEYVQNLAPESYLSGLRTSNGSKLFLNSEVEHMGDVKLVLLWATVLTLALVILAFLASRSLKDRAPGVIQKSLFSGALTTVALLAILAILGALGWETFFETFHHLFFPQGNWQFRMSDTLIRLYPPQFWVDAAVAVVLIALIISAMILAFTWPTRYRRQLAQSRAEERLELRRRLTAEA